MSALKRYRLTVSLRVNGSEGSDFTGFFNALTGNLLERAPLLSAGMTFDLTHAGTKRPYALADIALVLNSTGALGAHKTGFQNLLHAIIECGATPKDWDDVFDPEAVEEIKQAQRAPGQHRPTASVQEFGVESLAA